MELGSLANLSIVCVQQLLSLEIVNQIKDLTLDLMEKKKDVELEPHEIDPLCLLIGSLHVSGSLTPQHLGAII